jgi:hypothetical protein
MGLLPPPKKCPDLAAPDAKDFNTSCKKPYTGFLLYDNAIYSNIRV